MKRSQKKFHTEPFLLQLHKEMVRDLEPKNRDWFTDPRNYTGPRYDYWNAYSFKVMYQLEHMFKRVLLSSDPNFDELKDKSLRGFVESQKTFGLPKMGKRQRILAARVRDLVSGILGEFDVNRFFELCSFGKRAAAKLPYRESYLDTRCDRLNGSQSQIEWFKVALCRDKILHKACRLGLKQAKITDSLELKAVPKSHKAARIIAPDTTIGGFLSRGLGSLIRERLETNTHIALSTQQDRHKTLALRASADGYLATIDMSKASDSFVWEHVEAFVPESWHDILKTVRTDTAIVSGEQFELKSYMLMGSGHTFPLQTLLFYSIVKAVLELMGSSSKCDVYGDDIIFPAQYAYYVIVSLDNLGFTVNVDKSFIDGPFRESCGGDYHTGVDVRPFMPEHVCSSMNKHEYTENLHKWYNGLLRRWTYEEIPNTCNLILNEIVSIWGNLCPVPEHEVETCGLFYIPRQYEALVKPPQWKHWRCYYLKLVSKPRRRKPYSEKAYYWNWHRLSESGQKPTRLDEIGLRLFGVFDRPDDVCGIAPHDPYDDESAGTLDQNGSEPQKGGWLRYKWVSTMPIARKTT